MPIILPNDAHELHKDRPSALVCRGSIESGGPKFLARYIPITLRVDGVHVLHFSLGILNPYGIISINPALLAVFIGENGKKNAYEKNLTVIRLAQHEKFTAHAPCKIQLEGCRPA